MIDWEYWLNTYKVNISTDQTVNLVNVNHIEFFFIIKYQRVG